MTKLLTYSVASTLALFLAVPVLAQDFDMPPDLPGAMDESVIPHDDPIDATVASEGTIPEDDFAAPPDFAAVPDVPGDLPGELPGDIPDLDMAAAPDDNARTDRIGTLEVELRAFSNRDLAGKDTSAVRLQAHYFGTLNIGENASLLFNLRARTDKVAGQAYRFEDDFNLDVQELAFSYSISPQTSFQIGRINIRNGVAAGFNPTDWFKDDSLVVTGSAAPGDRRNERLGVFALTGTTTIGQTLLQFGYRPEFDVDAGSIWADRDNIGFGFDRTNASEAYYVKVSPQFGNNLSFTANALMLDNDPGLGFELSGTIGDNLVLYSEVMAQKRQTIAAEALSSGIGSPGFRTSVGADADKDWQYQAALGLNWALPMGIVGARDVSLTLEYHLNTAGLTASQIDGLAGATGLDLAAAGAIYGVANRRQEPLAREQLFTRFAWNDFWGDSDMSVLGFYVPADRSGLAQISVDVPIGQNATFNLRGIQTFGDDTSVYGANPTKRSLQMGLTYVF